MPIHRWPPSRVEPQRVVIAYVPVESTLYGEPVRPHVRHLMRHALESAGHDVVDAVIAEPSDIDDIAQIAPGSIVMNLCYGLRSSGGQTLDQPAVAAAMERVGLRLVGSDSAAQSRCQDKSLAAELARAADVGAPVEFSLDEALEQDGPLIVKPREGAAHRDVRIVHDPSTLAADPPSPDMMIQEYLDGPEYTIGVLGNRRTGVHVLPLTRIRLRRAGADPTIYDWASTTMAPDSGARFGLATVAETLFEAFGLHDYARFDLRVVAGRGPVLLDANALPNLAPRQLLATSARWAGITYPDLVNSIVAGATVRHEPTAAAAPP